MNLITKLGHLNYPDLSLSHKDEFILIGSCFSEHMKPHLEDHGFYAQSNPFGIIYNPHSISQLLNLMVSDSLLPPSSIIETDMGFTSFLTHSSFSFKDIDTLQNSFKKLHILFKEKPRTYVLTLGTSWVYKHIISQSLVANCHKIQASEFEKQLLSLEHIKTSLQEMILAIQTFNAKNEIIFTLSPVRHLKDGFVENQRSKSLLHMAIQEVIIHNNVNYFPAYEIMMDELRDYRFYAEDLLHPNPLAIKIIWDYFYESIFLPKSKEIGKEVFAFTKFQKHKILSKKSEVNMQHLQKINKQKADLVSNYPDIHLK